MNPRALGTNPSAGSDRDVRRVQNLRELALTVMHQHDRYHCDRCSDTGWYPTTDRADLLQPCHCRPITSREASAYLATFGPGEHARLSDYQRQQRQQRRRRW